MTRTNCCMIILSDTEQAHSDVTVTDSTVTETQYGSWTKLSIDIPLVHHEATTAPSEPPGVTAGEVSSLQSSSPASTTTCTQLLTQPPSVQQDSIIRKSVGPQ